jgi:hypothetical protein
MLNKYNVQGFLGNAAEVVGHLMTWFMSVSVIGLLVYAIFEVIIG